MTPEEAVRERVLDLGAVTALVSTRVYMKNLPQSPTYPCIRIEFISEQTEYHLRGGKTCRARVQVGAFAKQLSGVDPYALVLAVAAAVNGNNAGSGLSGFKGDIGSVSPTFHAQGIFRDTRMDPRPDPDDERVIMMAQDYFVNF